MSKFEKLNLSGGGDGPKGPENGDDKLKNEKPEEPKENEEFLYSYLTDNNTLVRFKTKKEKDDFIEEYQDRDNKQ